MLIGHSAGAHLVALIGTDPRWLNGAGVNIDDVRGIVALDGAAYDVPRQLSIGAPPCISSTSPLRTGPWRRDESTR